VSPLESSGMVHRVAEKTVADVERYWNARPCNVRHSPQPIGSPEYFDEVEARKYRVEPHIPSFADFSRWGGKRVLEVGCGIGTDTMNFARAGAAVTAVDLSAESLRIARERAKIVGVGERIRFVHANAEELSSVLAGESYDLVYAFGVVHHTPHPARALAQMRRLAAPGGTLRLMIYHRRSWKVLSIVARHGGRIWRTDELVAMHSEAQTGCPVTYTYTRRQARDLVEASGFRVRRLWVDHIFPYRPTDYVEYRYVKEPFFRWLPEPLFHALERRAGWHLMVDAECPV
jgi:ubiquinone/menaquinone biosynthesis C-methylase UbiE